VTAPQPSTLAFADIWAAVRSHAVIALVAFAVAAAAVIAFGATREPVYTATAVIVGDAREEAGSTVQESLAMTESLVAKLGPEMESSAFERAALIRIDPAFAAVPTDVTVTPDTTVWTVTIEAESTSAAAAAAWANGWAEEATLQPTGSELTRFRVLQVATPPTQPSSPGLAFYVAAGAFLGLLAGVVVALVSSGAARRRTARLGLLADHGIVILGVVPATRAFDKAARAGRDKPVPAKVRETVDGVAARLRFTIGGRAEQTSTGMALAVVPVGTTDAAAWLTTHLGRSLSTIAGVVACVDGNLRDPLLHAYLGSELTPGLADLAPDFETDDQGLGLAVGPGGVEQVLRPVEPSLMLIPGGRPTNSPIAVCATAVPRVLDHLGDEPVTTLVRCPEAGSPETAILAAGSTRILLVVDTDTSAERIAAVVADLKTYGDVLGAVLVGNNIKRDQVFTPVARPASGSPITHSHATTGSRPVREAAPGAASGALGDQERQDRAERDPADIGR
jgi:capsular polysaccharide biosynthesis protein